MANIDEDSTSAAANKNYADSMTFKVHDSRNNNTLAGVFTSNIDYTRKGTAKLNRKTVSVWDVKYFNQSSPRNSYQTREIITRSSVAPWKAETLRSYGPTTTGSSSRAVVGLSGLKPSVSWNFSTYSSTVKDYSRLSEKYARWVFNVSLGSSTAKTIYVMKPGVRVTNSNGNIGFQHVFNMDFYKNLNANPTNNSKAQNRYFPDL